ncbi:MAG: amidohydrolase [Candidatus Bipolaricaulota bacterium]|nr:MAG: amidohydrolase [Candidatus Bipolaricaulota bacterium]
MGTVFSNVNVWTPHCESTAPVDVRVEGGQIAAITSPGSAASPGDDVLDCAGMLALPGLINAHTHVAMALLRGCADDVPLHTWLEEHVWPIERMLTPDDVYWGSVLGLVEMVRAGTTQIVDMYFHVDAVGRAVRDVGLRANLSYGIVADSMDDVGRRELETAEGVVATWHGACGGRIRAAVAPHAVYSCGEDVLQAAAKLAGRYTVPIHTHLSEAEKEVDDWSNVHGVSPVATLERIGVLEVPTLAAHCVHVSEDDIERLAAHGVSVLHCPCSNAKLGNGVAPIAAMQRAGVNVALGTDGAASNNNLDLFREMRTAALLQKAIRRDANILSADAVLEMATENGARALGLATGTLAVGAPADVVVVDLECAHVQPIYDAQSALVYASHSDDVVDVMIDGAFVVREGNLMTVDEDEVRSEVKVRAGRLRDGMAHPGTAA